MDPTSSAASGGPSNGGVATDPTADGTPEDGWWKRFTDEAKRFTDEAKIYIETLLGNLWTWASLAGNALLALCPVFAGFAFGVGWWFWVDAIVCASEPRSAYYIASPISFLRYGPGVLATIATFTFVYVTQSHGNYYTLDGLPDWREKLGLFTGDLLTFLSIAGAAAFLYEDLKEHKTAHPWLCWASALQCGFVLLSGWVYRLGCQADEG